MEACCRTLALATALVLGGCDCDQPPAGQGHQPEALRLRHRFVEGRQLRYDSRTVEHRGHDVIIEMRTRWRVDAVGDDGSGELSVEIERYSQRLFPPTLQLASEAERLNEGLAGARFRLRVSADGRQVDHLGHQKVPEVSAFTVEALRTSLSGHVLRLPDQEVRTGQRWSTERQAAPDAGPGRVSSRSRWRVIAVTSRAGMQMVELACLSTMAPGPLRHQGQLVRNQTDFHYSYLWNATRGYLESLGSSGETVTVVEGEDGRVERQRIGFDGWVELLGTGTVAR